MFPLPALITREPRPANRSVARRSGIVLTISRRFFDTPPSCLSRKRRGLELAFKQPEECWNTSPPSPPPSSAARSAMKFAGNLVFRR